MVVVGRVQRSYCCGLVALLVLLLRLSLVLLFLLLLLLLIFNGTDTTER